MVTSNQPNLDVRDTKMGFSTIIIFLNIQVLVMSATGVSKFIMYWLIRLFRPKGGNYNEASIPLLRK